MEDKVRKHERICKELNSIYERKNKDYGDSFGRSFIEYGMTIVRNGGAAVNDESIDDTLLDLANYAIMTLIERGYGE